MIPKVFSQVGLPQLSKLTAALEQRPAVKLVGPQPRLEEEEEERSRHLLQQARQESSESGQPLSVINLPLSQFNLPFASVTTDREELPLLAKIQLARGREQSRQSGHELLSAGSRSGNLREAATTKLHRLPLPLDLPNKLSLPLSILDFPLSALDLPLEKVLLPFSNVNSLPSSPLDLPLAAAIPSTPFLRALRDEVPLPGPRQTESLASLMDRTREQPDIGDLGSLSLPYSFLNQPLAFFNLPLAFLQLPFADTNLPLAHLNLPFGFNNLPLFDLQKTFGLPVPKPALDDPLPLDETPSPLPTPQRRQEQPRQERVIRLGLGPRTQESLELAEEELGRFVAKLGALGRRASASESQGKPSESLELADGILASLFAARDSLKKEAPPPPPPRTRVGAAIDAIPDMDARSAEVFGRWSRVLRDTVPSVPDLGGIQNVGDSGLFLTPFSLFNLPLGFLDQPIAFTNLPLARFNLPLSHISLPFSGLALPVDDIAIPEFGLSPQETQIELSDLPPSVLEELSPDNPFNSYVNLPLSELNLPLAIIGMPFGVFDLPFAFLNLPLGHLNSPLTHVNLPFEISALPLANVGLPFESFIPFGG